MIHARKDYNRFQEPRELLEIIYRLVASHKGIPAENRQETDEYLDDLCAQLNAKYHLPSEGSSPIAENEPVFLLRGKDNLFTECVYFYANKSAELGTDLTHLIEPFMEYVQEWQTKNGTKNATVPDQLSLFEGLL